MIIDHRISSNQYQNIFLVGSDIHNIICLIDFVNEFMVSIEDENFSECVSSLNVEVFSQ